MNLNTEISIIISNLDTISKVYLDYDRSKQVALRDLRDKALSEKLEMIKRTARDAAASAITAMERAIDRMIEEVEKGNDYDVSSSAVADTARLLSVDDPDILSWDAVEKVIEKFRGNQVALTLIYSAASDANKALIKPMIFDNVAELNNIRLRIERLGYDPIENYPSCVGDVRYQLQEFARKQGVEMAKLTDSIEELRIRNIYALMGLDYAKNHPETYENTFTL